MTTVQPSRDETLHGADPGRAAFRRLHALGRVGLRGGACVHLQRPWLECTRCEDACPHARLKRGDGALEFDPAGCTACGLCTVACPTGALALEACAPGAAPAATPVAVVCERAAAGATAGHDAGHVRRVPCLGGLARNDWLRLALACAGAPLRMLDDGTCERCPTARGKGNPGLQALEAARRALTAAGVTAEALPQRVPAARLPNGDSGTPAIATAPLAARRAFFAGLSRALSAGFAQAAAPVALLAERPAVASRPRDAVPTVRGDETRLLMLQLARLNGRSAPREAPLSTLAASDACRAHGACARACPTGALQLEERDDRFVLRFDAWRCIDCGACASLCPERALEHRAAAWRAFVPGAVAIASTERRTCVRCGAAIAGHKGDSTADESALCNHCSKSRSLARAGFALFHSPGREPRVAPDPP